MKTYRGIHPKLPDEPEQPRIQEIHKSARVYPGLHVNLPMEYDNDPVDSGKEGE